MHTVVFTPHKYVYACSFFFIPSVCGACPLHLFSVTPRSLTHSSLFLWLRMWLYVIWTWLKWTNWLYCYTRYAYWRSITKKNVQFCSKIAACGFKVCYYLPKLGRTCQDVSGGYVMWIKSWSGWNGGAQTKLLHGTRWRICGQDWHWMVSLVNCLAFPSWRHIEKLGIVIGHQIVPYSSSVLFQKLPHRHLVLFFQVCIQQNLSM